MPAATPDPTPSSAESQRSDEELLLRFRDQGNTHAFDALVRRYEKELFRYLYHYLRNADLAEDVFQATFLNVYQKARLFDAARSFRPWLYSIATHLAVDAMRRAGRRSAVSLDAPPGSDTAAKPADLATARLPGPSVTAEKRERSRAIREAVERLPDHLRSALILVYFQGLKYREAAEVLDVPMGTLKSRIHQGIRKLKALLVEKPKRARTGRAEKKRPAVAVSDNPGLAHVLSDEELSADVEVPPRLASRTIQRLQG